MENKSSIEFKKTSNSDRNLSHLQSNSIKKSSASSYELEGGLDFGQLLGTIKRRFILITGITSVFTAGILVWSATRPPSYVSRFQILVEPVTAESEVVTSVTGGAKTNAAGEGLGQTQASKAILDYATQIEVLLSRQLLEPIAQELSGQFPQLRFENLTQSLRINRIASGKNATKILEVVYQSSTPEETQQVVNKVSQAYLKYSLSERQTNLKRAVQFTDRQLPVITSQVKNLEERLQKFQESNQVLDPSESITQLSQQLSGVETQLASTQLDLAKQRQLYASVQQQIQLQPNSAEAGSVLSEAPEYRALVTELQTVDTQLEVARGNLSEEHPTVLALKEQKDRLQPLVDRAAQNALGEKLAASIQNEGAIPFQTSLRRSLSQELIQTSIQISVLEVQSSNLLAAKGVLEQKLLKMPFLARQYDQIQRQLEISSNNLKSFLEKREELLINAARQEVPWELIEPPQEATSAILTSLPRDITLGVALGLLMGIGVAILLDKNSNVIHSLQQLREQSKLPVLGVIPVKKDLEDIAFSTLPQSSISDSSLTYPKAPSPQEAPGPYKFSPLLETFKSLQLQIRLLDPDNPVRSIVVSSILPSEGKTMVALHLAQAAAAMGQKVLLVDTDLRLPKVGERLKMQPGRGFVDYLVMEDQTINLNHFIQTLPYEKNLSILTAGTQPTDPTRILASKKMSDLMEQLNESYDFIIYDSPPLGLADPAIVASRTDGLLLVSKMGEVKQSMLKEALHALEIASIPVLGMVANGVQSKQLPYTNYEKYNLSDEE